MLAETVAKRIGNGCSIRNIHWHADDTACIAFPKFCDKFFKPFAGQIRDGDMAATIQQSPADTVSNRARRAGDDRCAAN